MTDANEQRQANETPSTAPCRTCAKPTRSDVASFPFCSARCQNADLGKWFNEEYRISRDIKDSDLETVD